MLLLTWTPLWCKPVYSDDLISRLQSRFPPKSSLQVSGNVNEEQLSSSGTTRRLWNTQATVAKGEQCITSIYRSLFFWKVCLWEKKKKIAIQMVLRSAWIWTHCTPWSQGRTWAATFIQTVKSHASHPSNASHTQTIRSRGLTRESEPGLSVGALSNLRL